MVMGFLGMPVREFPRVYGCDAPNSFFKLHDTLGDFLVQALESFRVAFFLQAINFDPEAVNSITSNDCHKRA